jgi:hypothetical protein
MDASVYALAHGVRATRRTLSLWRDRPWPILRSWLLGSLAAAGVLLVAILVIALVSYGSVTTKLQDQPPLFVGGPSDVAQILGHNLLVLALHAMACVAGFIAGSSLPLQAGEHNGLVRLVHERGQPVAMGFVVCATTFSLSLQAYAIGTSVAHVSYALHVPPVLLLIGLLPHAVPELVALFLPLAAWIVASRRGEWDRLLAATIVTVAVAVPTLTLTALWEVYVAPHLLARLFGWS